jgi:hypothetical protein
LTFFFSAALAQDYEKMTREQLWQYRAQSCVFMIERVQDNQKIPDTWLEAKEYYKDAVKNIKNDFKGYVWLQNSLIKDPYAVTGYADGCVTTYMKCYRGRGGCN